MAYLDKSGNLIGGLLAAAKSINAPVSKRIII